MVFSGLSPQESALGRSQEFGFEAALKRKVQSRGRCMFVSADVSLMLMFQLMRISLNVRLNSTRSLKYEELFMVSWDGFPSARDNNRFPLHLHCYAQTFTTLHFF